MENTQPLSAEEVFLRYRDTVYRLAAARTANRFAAEDITQEVFLRYMRRRPSFADEEHRKAWLLRVTVNCCRSLFASAWTRHTVPLCDEAASAAPFQSDVYDAVMHLPPDYRTVVHLHYYEGYAVKEIATLLSVRESTVKTRLFRAREKLREALSDETV